MPKYRVKMEEIARNKGHWPNLDTVLTIEKTVKDADLPPKRTELWKALPRQMMYQTFKTTLEYLEGSGKILIDKDDRVVWVGAESDVLEGLYKRALKVR